MLFAFPDNGLSCVARARHSVVVTAVGSIIRLVVHSDGVTGIELDRQGGGGHTNAPDRLPQQCPHDRSSSKISKTQRWRQDRRVRARSRLGRPDQPAWPRYATGARHSPRAADKKCL